MRIEISHDILASHIYEKASSDIKLRLKMKNFVLDRFKYYKETKELLSSTDLDYISPYINTLQAVLGQEELKFIRMSRKRRLIKKWGVFIGVTVCGSIAFIISTTWGIRESNRKRAMGEMNAQLETTLLELRKSNEEISRKNFAIDSLFRTVGQKDTQLSITAEKLLERDKELKALNEQLAEANSKLEKSYAQVQGSLQEMTKEKDKIETQVRALQKEKTTIDKAKTKLEKEVTTLKKEKEKVTQEVANLKNMNNTLANNEIQLKKANDKLVQAVEYYQAGNSRQARGQAIRAAIALWKQNDRSEQLHNLLKKLYKEETGHPDFSIPPTANIVQELELIYKN